MSVTMVNHNTVRLPTGEVMVSSANSRHYVKLERDRDGAWEVKTYTKKDDKLAGYIGTKASYSEAVDIAKKISYIMTKKSTISDDQMQLIRSQIHDMVNQQGNDYHFQNRDELKRNISKIFEKNKIPSYEIRLYIDDEGILMINVTALNQSFEFTIFAYVDPEVYRKKFEAMINEHKKE